MRKLLKILLKSRYVIILVIFFLCLEAYCELAIPEYTSKIVNIGIQQKGIETFVPQQIRTDNFQKLMFFLGEADKSFVTKHYSESNINGKSIYKYDDDKDAVEQLEDIFRRPLTLLFFSDNISDSSDLTADFSDVFGGNSEKPDISNPETLNTIMEKLNGIDDSILNQIAIQYVTEEYSVLGVDIEAGQLDYMKQTGVVMAIIALISMTCAISVSFFTSRIAAKFAHSVRNAVFRKVMAFSNSEFDSFSTASLITRSTNDIQQMQMVVGMLLRMLIFSPIMGFGAFYKVMRDGSSMGWVIGLAIGALLMLVVFLFTVALPKFQVLQKLVDKVNLVSREILTGLPVIRAFSKETHEKKRFDAANMDLMKVNLFVNRTMAIMFPSMFFIMNGVSVLIIWVGADTVNAGTLQVGSLIAFITYTMQIIMSFLMLSMMSVILPRAIISYKRVGAILDTEISVKDPVNPINFGTEIKGLIEFKNVSFHYKNAEADVLKNISLTMEPGQTTAIIGSTGSGKSTLANLIPRFFDVTDGEILIDGVNIKNVTLKDLRDKIGYIPQKAMLFSGTVKSNIAYSAVGYEMDEQQIVKAAQIAQAEEFIVKRENSYDSPISQGGSNVSGGQKQRLSIARAVAKNPEIYIFDDSFSALDFKTDVALRKALTTVTENNNNTVIIVAQRISTILDADKIIVLDEGEIAGIGSHKELLKNCDVYRDIAYSQLSASELEDNTEKEGD